MDNLKVFPLFGDMTDESAERYGARCIWRSYEAGEMIIDHHETSNDVRFIISGSVRIVVRMLGGREVILGDFVEGEFFGELAAIDGGNRSANVTAWTKARLCIMPQSVFRELIREVPDVGWQVMNHLVAIVRRLSDRLAEFSFLKAKYRLYSELLRLSRERKDHPDQRIISPSPVQSDIADRISSRREIVSREMKELERQGILNRTRGGLVIVNPPRLQALAEEGWNG